MSKPTNSEDESKKDHKLKRNIESLVWTIAVVLLIRAFLIQSYQVPSPSMSGTLLPGDFLIAAKFVYGIEIPYTNIRFFDFYKPSRGNVVIFTYPVDMKKDFVKRCVGVAGDTVEIINKRLYVNGIEQEEPHVVHRDNREYPPVFKVSDEFSQKEYQMAWENGEFMENVKVRDNFGPVVVPEGHIFAMGDNRDNSMDSRYWGPLSTKLVKAAPVIIYFSWDKDSPYKSFFERIRIGRFLKILLFV
jgi:signal peptidase I